MKQCKHSTKPKKWQKNITNGKLEEREAITDLLNLKFKWSEIVKYVGENEYLQGEGGVQHSASSRWNSNSLGLFTSSEAV